ncbi:MAG: ABC transporter substrate-binding protein [Dehalococcoidia bacterium]
MGNKSSLWYKFTALILVLSLIIPVLAACGDNEEETATPAATIKTTPTATATPISKPTPAATASSEPVKIGVVLAWSGPSAIYGALANQDIAVVDEYLKRIGGILGGRPVHWVKYDTGGQLAKAAAGYIKIDKEDNVVIMVGGGGSIAEFSASAEAATKQNLPHVTLSGQPIDLTPYPYTVRAGSIQVKIKQEILSRFILDKLNSQKVAFLGDNQSEVRERVSLMRKTLEAAGVETVYEEYADSGTSDFSPYLTRMKYKNPDLLLNFFGSPASHMAIFKQIEGLGGWGNIKCLDTTGSGGSADLAKMAGAQGTYSHVLWAPGLDYPGAKQFEEIFMKMHGKLPSPFDVPIYLCLMTALNAIDQAGTTDREGIAKYMRSGKLEWDSPAGLFKIGTDGENNLTGIIGELRGGKIIPVALE